MLLQDGEGRDRAPFPFDGRRASTRSVNSSNRRGRCLALGRRNPYSTSVRFRDMSPSNFPVELRHGDVGLVDHASQRREVVEQRVRRLAGLAAVDVARVVLDAAAESDLPHHLEVVVGAHPERCASSSLFSFERRQLLLELLLDVWAARRIRSSDAT